MTITITIILSYVFAHLGARPTALTGSHDA